MTKATKKSFIPGLLGCSTNMQFVSSIQVGVFVYSDIRLLRIIKETRYNDIVFIVAQSTVNVDYGQHTKRYDRSYVISPTLVGWVQTSQLHIISDVEPRKK